MMDWTKLPIPTNPEAEAALLGSIMIDWCRRLPDGLDAGDFHDTRHAVIFEALRQLNGEQERVDIITIKSHLEHKQQLQQVGGVDYLQHLVESVPHAESMQHYGDLVRRAADGRRLLEQAERIAQAASRGDDPSEVIEQAQQGLVQLVSRDSKQPIGPSIGDDVDAVYERLERLSENPSSVETIKSGLPDLDQMTGGLAPGQLVILAASTGAGKSALGQQIALNMAARQQAPVGVFSLEMTRQQMAERLLALESSVPLDTIRGLRTPNGDAFGQLAEAVGRLKDVPIYPVHHRNLTPDRMAASARYLRDRHGIRAIVVDYLQLMHGTRRDSNRYSEVSELSRSVKLLALELGVPVLCLSQINRESVRQDRRPRLSDLRDSGSIEQDADLVLFLHNPNGQAATPSPGYEPDEVELELIVAKQRQGATGGIRLRFDGARQRFRNITPLEGVEART